MSGNKGVGKLRPVNSADLDRLVELDFKNTGHKRQGFYAKRLQASVNNPEAFISIGIEADGKLAGFVLAHILDGEFGGNDPVAVLDAIGVDPEVRGKGLARALMAGLDEHLKLHKVREVRTQADWSEIDLIRFFASAGFSLAPTRVLERVPTHNSAF
jgi:ribosomal protein S18 acetylase RimI-like enzyme